VRVTRVMLRAVWGVGSCRGVVWRAGVGRVRVLHHRDVAPIRAFSFPYHFPSLDSDVSRSLKPPLSPDPSRSRSPPLPSSSINRRHLLARRQLLLICCGGGEEAGEAALGCEYRASTCDKWMVVKDKRELGRGGGSLEGRK
jgi:hypothetical protein